MCIAAIDACAVQAKATILEEIPLSMQTTSDPLANVAKDPGAGSPKFSEEGIVQPGASPVRGVFSHRSHSILLSDSQDTGSSRAAEADEDFGEIAVGNLDSENAWAMFASSTPDERASASSPGRAQQRELSLGSIVTDYRTPRSRAMSKIPTLSSEGQRATLRTMVTLTLSSPDLLRATHAAAPLRCFGAVLRNKVASRGGGFGRCKAQEQAEAACGSHCAAEGDGCQCAARASRACDRGDYTLSFPTEYIDDFWSHSWSGHPSLKALVLLLQYNLRAAAAAGMLAAIGAAVLNAYGLLPAMLRRHSDDGFEAFGAWSLLLGSCAFTVVLLFWQSRKRVFLDKVCIEQYDLKRKQQGVECIGAFLDHSKQMIVLWEPSYATRLWCVFEMAAFAWTHNKDVSNRIIVRPLVIGAVFLGLMMTAILARCVVVFMPAGEMTALTMGLGPLLCAVTCLPCVHLLRRLDRDMRILSYHLREFTVAHAECFCCTASHVDADTGARISCDREVIQACIVAWFGSLQEFEAFVQSDLAPHFRQSLGRLGVPYLWVAASQMPWAWSYLDLLTPLLAGRHWLEAASVALEGLTVWLCVSPLVVAFIIRITGFFQRRRHGWAADAAVTLLTGLLALLPIVLLEGGLYTAKNIVLGHELVGILAYSCIAGLMTGAVYKWG